MNFYPYGQSNFSGGYVPQTQSQMYNAQPTYNAQPQQQQVQTQSLPKTNKIFVTSLEEAMNRSVEPNTVIIYLHQDLPLLFEITTDFFGKKSYRTFDLTESVQKPQKSGQDAAAMDLSGYVTRKEFDAIQGQLDGLKSVLEKYDLKSKKQQQKEIIGD